MKESEAEKKFTDLQEKKKKKSRKYWKKDMFFCQVGYILQAMMVIKIC